MSAESQPPVTPTATQAKRPGAVTTLIVLLIIGALLQLVATVIAILFALRPGVSQEVFGQPVSDFYAYTTAILSFLLALIYFWIARGMAAGDPQAWLLVNVLAIINVVFAIFQLPFGSGWAALVLNIVILALNNTARTRSWFSLPNG